MLFFKSLSDFRWKQKQVENLLTTDLLGYYFADKMQ